MLIDPRMLLEYWVPIVVLSLLVVVGKVVTCSFGTFVGGRDLSTSLCVGMGLAQIGEFSFIIAGVGEKLEVTSDFLYPIAVAVSVITTLVTPYLIRATDPMVRGIDRVAPRGLMQALEVYTAWIGSFAEGSASPVTLLVRRMGWQLLVNVLLTVGIFALGAWVAQLDTPYNYLPKPIRTQAIYTTLVWFAVMLLSSGIYLASARKIQAMSMLVAEVAVPFASGGQSAASVRMVISQVFVLLSFVVMGFLTILLSTSILSSVSLIVPLLGIGTGMIFLFRRILVRVYSRAELALHETLIELPRLQRERPKVIKEILRDAELDTMEIPPGSVMIGRRLRDIPLRQQTGASIVAIERHGQRVINPGPDETIQQGDRVLLLGELEQLPAACDLLAMKAE